MKLEVEVHRGMKLTLQEAQNYVAPIEVKGSVEMGGNLGHNLEDKTLIHSCSWTGFTLLKVA